MGSARFLDKKEYIIFSLHTNVQQQLGKFFEEEI